DSHPAWRPPAMYKRMATPPRQYLDGARSLPLDWSPAFHARGDAADAVVDRQLAGAVMVAAQDLIVELPFVGVADDDAFAFAHDRAVGDPCIQDPVGAAPAQDLDLQPEHLVGELE